MLREKANQPDCRSVIARPASAHYRVLFTTGLLDSAERQPMHAVDQGVRQGVWPGSK